MDSMDSAEQEQPHSRAFANVLGIPLREVTLIQVVPAS